MAEAGALCVALLHTEPTPNDYLPLPVREGDHDVVRVSRFAGAAAHAAHLRRAQESPACTRARAALESHLGRPPLELRLEPTARSLLR